MISVPRFALPLILFLFFLSGVSHAAGVQWLPYKEAMKKAQTEDKFVYLYFYSDRCPWCVKMDKEVLEAKEVGDYLNKNYLSARIRVEDQEDIAALYRVRGFPAHFFLTKKGESVLFARPGYIPEETFLRMLQLINIQGPKE